MQSCAPRLPGQGPCEWVSDLVALLQALEIPVLAACLDRGGRAWLRFPSPEPAGRFLGAAFSRGHEHLRARILDALRASYGAALPLHGWAFEESDPAERLPWVAVYVPHDDLRDLYAALEGA